MAQPFEVNPNSDRELTIGRIINAPRGKVWRCWTEPSLIKQWFAPKPWTVSHVENDVRSGGSTLITMRSPEGQEVPGPGIYLEVLPQQKLVFTDAFTKAWEPSERPFMVVTLTMEDEGAKTRYTVRAQHFTKEGVEEHKKMGFEAGWGICTDQLEALAASL
jgi:uncharacterized protein YndB with AHSA1/START domain